MLHTKTLMLLGTLAGMAAAATPAAAQSAQKWSLQGSFFSSSLYGDNPIFANVDAGAGFEIQARWTPGVWSIGAGFQWTSHPQNLFASEPGVVGDPNTTLNGVFIEPRYVISIHSNTVAPYLSARLSGVKQTTTVNVQQGAQSATFTATANGVNINGGGGLLFRLGGSVNLDLGATYGYSSFGDFVTKVNGTETDRLGASSGQNLAVRAGLAVGL